MGIIGETTPDYFLINSTFEEKSIRPWLWLKSVWNWIAGREQVKESNHVSSFFLFRLRRRSCWKVLDRLRLVVSVLFWQQRLLCVSFPAFQGTPPPSFFPFFSFHLTTFNTKQIAPFGEGELWLVEEAVNCLPLPSPALQNYKDDNEQQVYPRWLGRKNT